MPPPEGVKPDSVAPKVAPGDHAGSFDRYGFRVPAGVVSPYARRNDGSSVVHDRTSVHRLLETRWNLPALTHRVAAADNMPDRVDLVNPPAFLTPPTLAAAPDPSVLAGCLSTGRRAVHPGHRLSPAPTVVRVAPWGSRSGCLAVHSSGGSRGQQR